MSKVMTPFEAAVDLVRPYAERGDDLDGFRKGQLGCYCSDYHASVGGYMKGKKYPTTKIVVEEVNKEEVNEVFDLETVWNYILQEKTQATLF